MAFYDIIVNNDKTSLRGGGQRINSKRGIASLPLAMSMHRNLVKTWPGIFRLMIVVFSLVAGMLGTTGMTHAQSSLDGFDPNSNGSVKVIAVQADGKIVVGGMVYNPGRSAPQSHRPFDKYRRCHTAPYG